MTLDLFASEPALERLQIEDAEISFARQIDLGEPTDEVLRELIDSTPWRQEAVTIYGKKHLQPRLVAWYGDVGRTYSYSGISLEPLLWTDTLAKLRDIVQDLVNERFNSVLLNYYRDHRDSMGFHSDDEKELGPTPVIASVSLGATRTFVLKHKTRPELSPVRLELPSGSLLLMKGLTQKNWKHGIDKQSKPCGPRVNLTFRRIVPR
ncbi:alpha-ketoglutarate-dependent dioxygenase AlkB [Ideonella azotifigens]|uniref:Alpha-ketoglutarate-dependent dioxygenase AlkB n=1 Tax=Ideonella azotifigens TaxID=513160 RepID=A0ABP3UT50_9BURK|nr:alpha-ketoglutarate-dependent dioxygenase AlkB [Ideonella azotifigens]MCD2339680.1 alpha-ketoglutarate-dependent dioxygenase AlkB [Ideonella azotifigens]